MLEKADCRICKEAQVKKMRLLSLLRNLRFFIKMRLLLFYQGKRKARNWIALLNIPGRISAILRFKPARYAVPSFLFACIKGVVGF